MSWRDEELARQRDMQDRLVMATKVVVRYPNGRMNVRATLVLTRLMISAADTGYYEHKVLEELEREWGIGSTHAYLKHFIHDLLVTEVGHVYFDEIKKRWIS